MLLECTFSALYLLNISECRDEDQEQLKMSVANNPSKYSCMSFVIMELLCFIIHGYYLVSRMEHWNSLDTPRLTTYRSHYLFEHTT